MGQEDSSLCEFAIFIYAIDMNPAIPPIEN